MNAKASTAALRPPVRSCSFFRSAFRAARLAVKVPTLNEQTRSGRPNLMLDISPAFASIS